MCLTLVSCKRIIAVAILMCALFSLSSCADGVYNSPPGYDYGRDPNVYRPNPYPYQYPQSGNYGDPYYRNPQQYPRHRNRDHRRHDHGRHDNHRREDKPPRTPPPRVRPPSAGSSLITPTCQSGTRFDGKHCIITDNKLRKPGGDGKINPCPKGMWVSGGNCVGK